MIVELSVIVTGLGVLALLAKIAKDLRAAKRANHELTLRNTAQRQMLESLSAQIVGLRLERNTARAMLHLHQTVAPRDVDSPFARDARLAAEDRRRATEIMKR